MKMTVCTRPFRPMGPRLAHETIDGKRIVHSYGHGGSGWSLSWGCAEDAAQLAIETAPKTVAVVGAGAIGLTTATVLAEHGLDVTIYAKDFPMESRSARATGVWSPSSRIAMQNAAGPNFPTRWEALARRSYSRHLNYVGRAGAPVEFTPRFYVPASAAPVPNTNHDGEIPTTDSFLHLDRRLSDILPRWSDYPDHPFPRSVIKPDVPVRAGLMMTFNVAEYTRQLRTDFERRGGRLIRATFGRTADLGALPVDLVVNCTGYGAKTLFGDDTLVPVRGQIAWLAPQADRLYGVYHRSVSVLSRRDGLLIQETGPDDFYGYGAADETPDRDEFTNALAKVAPLFAWRSPLKQPAP